MREKIKKLSYIVPTVIFLTFVFIIMIMTYRGSVQETVENTKFTFTSYIELSDKSEKILQENIFKKYGFINLNGRMARVLRINSLNTVEKLDNGFLTFFDRKRDGSENIKRLVQLNNFLAERGIYFLYLLAPTKNSMYDVKFAPGYTDESRQNMINMVRALNEAEITNINMADWFEKNNWHMEDVFFKTDHHWKPQAGLAAARCTMNLFQQEDVAEYDEIKLQDKSYRIKILRNWLLGSQGQRVGKYYGGVDNISVYYPKFKTDYYFARLLKTNMWTYGKNILTERLIKNKNYFTTNPYMIYFDWDPAIHIVYNKKATNNKKILITGNSFRKVYEYFLTTQFQEIHYLDLRYYRDGTFAQYIEEIKPDIVIMCVSTGNGIDAPIYYNFGVEEYLSALAKPFGIVHELGDIELKTKEEDSGKFEVLCSNLKPGQTYTLTVDRTMFSGVKELYIRMALQNFPTNEAIYNRYFDANSDKVQKWIFTTPEKSDGNYGIYIYAGEKGRTTKLEGIKLQKGILED